MRSHDERCTPSARASIRTVTGAYEPASGICSTICFMMSGFPCHQTQASGRGAVKSRK